MCARVHTHTHTHTPARVCTHAPQILITTAMFLFVICVYIYSNLVTLPLPVSWTVHESIGILSLEAQIWLGKSTEINLRVAQHTTMQRKLLKASLLKQ